MSDERDSVWRRTDGVRVRMSVTPGDAEAGTNAVMTLTPFGAENDGARGESFTLIGSVPVEVSA